MVGVSGSAGSVSTLRRALAEARARGAAELRVVLAWQAPGGGLGGRAGGDARVPQQCHEASTARLRHLLDEVFGPEPLGSEPLGPAVVGLAVRATPGAALVASANDPEDLIVLGAGQRNPLHRLLRPSVARHCLTHAVCPVLSIPPTR
ncbi:universal stress protein (plasmid) [Streptomyces sp. BI20]|uniref:universal stress protein n=1 Tax=Streptomyces sp. BI20 TaxID=3403460 RepID=UPI003C794B3E